MTNNMNFTSTFLDEMLISPLGMCFHQQSLDFSDIPQKKKKKGKSSL